MVELTGDHPGREPLHAAGDERYNWDVLGPGVGDQVGGFRIESLAGRGGMGVVYRAVQVELDRVVALKLISPGNSWDPLYRERFRRESRLAASIEHRNVLPVYEAGELDGGDLYLAMRWVDGTDLQQLLRLEDRLTPARAVALLAPVALALDAAHARGLVHRDVKPANVLIANQSGSEGEHVYLTDFGIAREADHDDGLTATGGFVGTLDYASPERIGGDRTGRAADIYALGCVAFETLTGWAPFSGESVYATMSAHLNDPIPSVREHCSDVPAALDEVIATALAKDPGERFPSAAHMAAALAGALADDGVATTSPGRRRPPAAVRGNAVTERRSLPTARAGGALTRRRRAALALAAVTGCAAALLTALTLGAHGPSSSQASPNPSVTRSGIAFRTIYHYTTSQKRVLGPAVPVGSDVWVNYGNHLGIVNLAHPGDAPIQFGSPTGEGMAVDPTGRVWFPWVQGNSGGQELVGVQALRTLAVIPLPEPGVPIPVIFGGGYAWTAGPPDGAASVERISLRSSTAVGGPIHTDHHIFDLAYRPDGAVWVSGIRGWTVVVNVIRDGRAGPDIEVGSGHDAANYPTSAVADGNDGLWLGTDAGPLIHLDSSGHRVSSPVQVGRGTTLVAQGGDRIWVLAMQSDTLASIPMSGPDAGRVTTSATIPGTRAPDGLSCAPHICVITDHQAGTVVDATF